MVKITKKKNISLARVKDWYVYVILFGISVLVRAPFFDAFDHVAYDGTYYINQAKGLLGSPHLSGAFPIGYPIFIAILAPFFLKEKNSMQKVGLLAIAFIGIYFVLNEEGSLFVVKASSQGYRELARAEGVLPGICWTAPTLSQGRLYLRNDKGSVRCLDLN